MGEGKSECVVRAPGSCRLLLQTQRPRPREGHTALGGLPATVVLRPPPGLPPGLRPIPSPRLWSPSWPVLPFYILSCQEEGDIGDVGLTPNLRVVG